MKITHLLKYVTNLVASKYTNFFISSAFPIVTLTLEIGFNGNGTKSENLKHENCKKSNTLILNKYSKTSFEDDLIEYSISDV